MPDIPIHVLAQMVAYALLIGKLAFSGLIRSYPFFTVLLGFEFLRLAASIWIRLGTNAYAYLYFGTQPLAWILHALVVFEVYQAVLKAHPGIATIGRRAALVAVIAAGVVSSITLLIRFEAPDSPFASLERYLLIERVINSSLLVFLIVLLAFLAYFPVRLSRNALLHACVFALYFLARTTLWIIRNLLGPTFTQTMNVVMPGLVVAAILAWLFLLSPTGENYPVRSSRRADKQEEERLIAQLESINATLLQTSKK